MSTYPCLPMWSTQDLNFSENQFFFPKVVCCFFLPPGDFTANTNNSIHHILHSCRKLLSIAVNNRIY